MGIFSSFSNGFLLVAILKCIFLVYFVLLALDPAIPGSLASVQAFRPMVTYSPLSCLHATILDL